MGIFEMIVAIVLITTVGSAVEQHLKNQRRSRSGDTGVEEALRRIRDEMAEVRRSTTDVVLSFESTLQRLEARVQHLERTALGGAAGQSAISAGGVPAPASQQVRETELVVGPR